MYESKKSGPVRSALALVLLLGVLAPASALAYASVVVVHAPNSPSERDTVQQALAGITDAGPEKPYLLKIEPGIYEITSTIVGKPYVDIEGSGEGGTIVRTALDVQLPANFPMFQLAANQEVRALTFRDSTSRTAYCLIEARGAGKMRYVTIEDSRSTDTQALCVYASASFDHVVALGRSAIANRAGVGASVFQGGPTFEHCTFVGEPYFSNYGTGLFVTNYDAGTTRVILLKDSYVYGTRYGIFGAETYGPPRIDLWIRNSVVKTNPGGYVAITVGSMLRAFVSGTITDLSGDPQWSRPFDGSGVWKCGATFTDLLAPVTCP